MTATPNNGCILNGILASIPSPDIMDGSSGAIIGARKAIATAKRIIRPTAITLRIIPAIIPIPIDNIQPKALSGNLNRLRMPLSGILSHNGRLSHQL